MVYYVSGLEYQQITMYYIFLTAMKFENPQKTPTIWTSQQDRVLWKLGSKNQQKNWKLIATQINSRKMGIEKSGKQCRERFTNYLRFGIDERDNNNRWTPQEDELLFYKFLKYGSKWAVISQQLTNKTENIVKNRFYNAFGRIERQIRKAQLKLKLKNKKPITSARLIKIFRLLGHQLLQANPNPLINSSSFDHINLPDRLAQNLIRMATEADAQPSKQQVTDIINDIHELQIRLSSRTSHQMRQAVELSSRIQSETQKQEKELMFSAMSKKNPERCQVSSPKEHEDTIPRGEMQGLELQLFLLPELSQAHQIQNRSKNLQQDLCNIENREYIPQNFTFQFE